MVDTKQNDNAPAEGSAEEREEKPTGAEAATVGTTDTRPDVAEEGAAQPLGSTNGAAREGDGGGGGDADSQDGTKEATLQAAEQAERAQMGAPPREAEGTETPASDTPEAPTTDTAGASESAGPSQKPGAAEARIAELEAENAELKDKLLRAMAEMENLRKRTARELSEMAKYAIADFAKSLLSVGDSMQRARQAVPEEAVAQDPVLKSFVEGIEMTEKEFLKALERHGITRYDPKGEPFDPNLHHAMLEVDAPGAPPKSVVDVFEHGYKIADRVLRSASVSIAKGDSSKASQAAEASGGGSGKGEAEEARGSEDAESAKSEKSEKTVAGDGEGGAKANEHAEAVEHVEPASSGESGKRAAEAGERGKDKNRQTATEGPPDAQESKEAGEKS